ncbi:MAG TPA: AI-2E family transporter [Candidatus Tidjanibacter gallistercoris]|nr:AI-2E family transporter [Candidatus Tidjanibacter gallistercoris]
MEGAENDGRQAVHATRYVVGVLATVAGLLLMWYFRDIVGYIVASAVLAIIGAPLVKLMRKVRVKGRSLPGWLAALVVLLVLWGVGVAMFAIFIPLIFDKLTALASVDFSNVLGSFDEPLRRLQNFLDEYFSLNVSTISISDAIGAQVERLFNPEKLQNFLGSIVSGVANTVIALFSVTFITFFFLKDDNLFLRIILAVTPTRYEGNVKHALGSVSSLLSRYFIGILAESTIMMLLVSVSLICCGYMPQNAFFIGLIVGVLNVIPYVGPWIGFGISLLVGMAFVGGGTTMTFIFFSLAITILAAQMIDNFVLQPLLYSNSVNAHPLEIFIVILMAGHFAGVVGMLLAIPGYTVLRVIGKEFFNHFKIVRKLTEKM